MDREEAAQRLAPPFGTSVYRRPIGYHRREKAKSNAQATVWRQSTSAKSVKSTRVVSYDPGNTNGNFARIFNLRLYLIIPIYSVPVGGDISIWPRRNAEWMLGESSRRFLRRDFS